MRASAPGELLHLDVTVIRLLDGTRAYLHAAIDNYSRRILSWSLEDRLGSGGMCRLLREAARQLHGESRRTAIVTEAGCENVNSDVDGLLEDDGLRRTLAQLDVTFSNSMIEAFWRSLKHSWLYLHSLDSIESLRRSSRAQLRRSESSTMTASPMPKLHLVRSLPLESRVGHHLIVLSHVEIYETESGSTGLRPAACAARTPFRQRCSCNATGPERHETQQGHLPHRLISNARIEDHE